MKKCCSGQATDTWTKLSPMGTPPSSRFGHTAVATAVGFYIFGGYGGRLRDLNKKAGPGLNHRIADGDRLSQRLAPLQRGAGPCGSCVNTIAVTHLCIKAAPRLCLLAEVAAGLRSPDYH